MAVHRVAIVGGGFGGLFAAKALGRADVDVTLIDRTNHHLFQPLLYQLATGTGFKNRISVLFNWTVAFLSDERAQRVITKQQVFARQALEAGSFLTGTVPPKSPALRRAPAMPCKATDAGRAATQ